MGDPSLRLLSATELLDGYTRFLFSPLDVVRSILDGIQELNPTFQCFLSVDEEGAIRMAKEAEKEWHSGLRASRRPADTKPLAGIPVSVKDSIEVEGLPTTYGSVAFAANHQPDSEIARRLRDAGAILIGKTNLPEFALSTATANKLGRPGRNAWNPRFTCGGSSGGAAAAVALGLGPVAIGTDSAGSIRCPAAYNGVLGLKPSYQRIPTVQRWRAAPGRSHNGLITRTVDDTLLLMHTLARPHPLDPDSLVCPAIGPGESVKPLSAYRVAIARHGIDGDATGSDVALVEEAARIFTQQGCEVIDASPPRFVEHVTSSGVWPYAADHLAAAEQLCPDFLERHSSDLTDKVHALYASAIQLSAYDYRLALSAAHTYRTSIWRWFENHNVDLLLLPAAGPPPLVDQLGPSGTNGPTLSNHREFNVSRNPAVAVPFGFDREGAMPVAVQIVARYGDDMGVMRAAKLLENAKPWKSIWPPIVSRM